jgi:hypothetical protein
MEDGQTLSLRQMRAFLEASEEVPLSGARQVNCVNGKLIPSLVD